ncbi:DctP family TRAP transporter solute-binding subunit [Lentibacillus sp. CBA3610]|uniref:TRAP transporter substrate-binding protein n=1 Tax=Lentibacillus sp. CBA3610 TaxID=2518176 RepID=UPI001599EF7D|nr:DctP family TRAP transporter solute-binding subunit [Lentibacillus sp. CBA3610]QKY70267.1 DctP family TRAP transporter solute-binding subunit [Lentibacillus sp. CBA3610]
MKKVILYLLTGLLITFVLVGCNSDSAEGGSEGGGDTVELQLGHALSPGTPANELIEEMAGNVEEQTDGRVKINVFPDSQLGSETEMLEQMQVGSMEAATIMVGSMQALDKRMAIEDLPYMWKDIDHARAAYDGEFGDYLAGVMDEQGMKKIAYLEWGFRHITNNEKPIVEPSDMEGVKIRVSENSLRVDAFEQIGALPTSLAFSELYGALQQGTVDAQENPLANIAAAKFSEVQDYLSLTKHFYNTTMMVIDNETWDSISSEDQEIIMEEGERITKEVRELNDEQEEEYINQLKDEGMEVNDNVDTAAFREQMLPVYEEWEDEFGQELMDIYRDASGW